MVGAVEVNRLEVRRAPGNLPGLAAPVCHQNFLHRPDHVGVEGVTARYSGAHGKENVGMSNDKGCEKHPRQKTQVS